MRVYADSNVFVYYILNSPEHALRCKHFIQQIQDKKIEAVTSQLTLVETHYAVAKYLGKAAATDAVKGMLSLPIIFVDLGMGVLQEAMHRIEEHDLSMFDAAHLATALANGAELIYSYDRDFDKVDIPRKEP